MEQVKIWRINGNIPKKIPRLRYSIIETKDEYYLIDNDRTRWRHALPITNWIVPDESMKINLSETEIETLLLNREEFKKQEENKPTAVGLATLFGGPITMLFINPIFEQLGIQLSESINLIIVLLMSGYILFMKKRNSKKAEKILDIIGRDNLTKQRMRIFPKSVSQGIKVWFIFAMVFMMALFCSMHFIFDEANESNPILFLAGAIGLYLYINMNSVSKTNIGKYQIKIIDE